MTTAAVLGSNGQVGTLLVDELVARGTAVRAVSRNGESSSGATPGSTGAVRRVAADLADAPQTVAATAGSDVVFHVAGAPYADWGARLPALLDAAIAAARENGAVLVYLDNAYAYGPVEGAMRPMTPFRPQGPLGRIRAELVERLLSAQDVTSVIVRVSDFYGAGKVRSTPGALVLDRLAAGRTGQWPFRDDQPHALHYLPDVARGLATIGTSPQAAGRTWHLPAAPASTGAEFVRAAARAFGRPERVSVLRAPLLGLASLVSADARDLRSLAYQYTAPFLLDASATSLTFGAAVEPTSHADALSAVAAATGR